MEKSDVADLFCKEMDLEKSELHDILDDIYHDYLRLALRSQNDEEDAERVIDRLDTLRVMLNILEI